MNELIIKKFATNDFTLEEETATMIEIRVKGDLRTILKDIIKYYNEEIKIEREDCFGADHITRRDLYKYIGRETANKLSDTDMEQIASKMSEVVHLDYWTALKAALENLEYLGPNKKIGKETGNALTDDEMKNYERNIKALEQSIMKYLDEIPKKALLLLKILKDKQYLFKSKKK